MRPCRHLPLLVAASLLAVSLTAAHEPSNEEHESQRGNVPRSINARWQVIAGGSLTTFDTDGSLSSGSVPIGIVIRFEDDLGLAKSIDTFLVGVRYRINPRNCLQVSYTDLSRSATRTVDRDITFGDVTFRAGATVATRFGTEVWKLKWKYDFADSPRLNAGLSAGLSSFAVDLGLSGSGEVEADGVVSFEEFADESVTVFAPVPVIGFYLDYAFSKRWTIRLEADALELSVSGSRGRIMETTFNSEYWFTPLFGLGFGLGSQDIEYTADDDNQELNVRYRTQSFLAYLSFAIGSARAVSPK